MNRMLRLLPNDLEKYQQEDEIHARFEAGELLSYEDLEELDDESTALVLRRLAEKGMLLSEVPGDGWVARLKIIPDENTPFYCPNCGKKA